MLSVCCVEVSLFDNEINFVTDTSSFRSEISHWAWVSSGNVQLFGIFLNLYQTLIIVTQLIDPTKWFNLMRHFFNTFLFDIFSYCLEEVFIFNQANPVLLFIFFGRLSQLIILMSHNYTRKITEKNWNDYKITSNALWPHPPQSHWSCWSAAAAALVLWPRSRLKNCLCFFSAAAFACLSCTRLELSKMINSKRWEERKKK